jgi:hypothetical protein
MDIELGLVAFGTTNQVIGSGSGGVPSPVLTDSGVDGAVSF